MRSQIINAIATFIRSRPGLEYGNYDTARSYRAECRQIARDKRDAETLLSAVALSPITAEELLAAFPRAYSGRLSWDAGKLEYCVGQYYPTEYRKAVCSVLASALWSMRRESMAAESGGEIRASFRRQFGRGIASRWFN